MIVFCIQTSFIQRRFLRSVITHVHWTLIQNMAEKSAESYVSLKGNDKVFSFFPNVVKVMVVLKRVNRNVTKFDVSFISLLFR